MGDVYAECGECDGSGEVRIGDLPSADRELAKRDALEHDGEVASDDDLVTCPKCGGDGEVWVRWEETPWEAGGFDSEEDWEDNMF
ncbi:hypothetical protein [Rubrivirga sp. IMCC45206]|uniref:hypothetical protein n=1 Tax=Rubrivirga sp. IMCC45206 TaxID=3391614 RepID=UPI003990154E